MIIIIILIIIIIMMMIIIILIIIVIVFIVISRIHTVKANSDGKKKNLTSISFVVILWFGNHKITTRLNRRGSTGGLGGLNPPLGGPKNKQNKKGEKKEEKKKKKKKKNARWRETLSSANIVRRYSTHLVT